MFRSIIIVLAIVAATTNAWVVPKNLQKAAATAAVSGALLTAPLVSNAISPPEFDGSYTDPNHPYCLRVIQTPGDSNGKAEISGTDGKCAPDGSGGTDWRVSGKVKGNTLIADFSSKGGPKNLKGKWAGDGITWSDGNKWLKKLDSIVDSGV